MDRLNLPSSRGTRIFAGVVFLIGGAALVITSFSYLVATRELTPKNIAQAVIVVPFGSCILIAGIRFLVPRKQ